MYIYIYMALGGQGLIANTNGNNNYRNKNTKTDCPCKWVTKPNLQEDHQLWWNLLPLLPKLHLMNEIGKRCKRLPLKKWGFFFLFLLFSLRLCFFCLPLQTKFSSGGTATTKRHMTNSIMIKCWECNFGWAHPRKYLRCCQRWWTNRK